MANFEN